MFAELDLPLLQVLVGANLEMRAMVVGGAGEQARRERATVRARTLHKLVKMAWAAVFQRDTAGFALGITREGTTELTLCWGDGSKLAAGANGEKRSRASCQGGKVVCRREWATREEREEKALCARRHIEDGAKRLAMWLSRPLGFPEMQRLREKAEAGRDGALTRSRPVRKGTRGLEMRPEAALQDLWVCLEICAGFKTAETASQTQLQTVAAALNFVAGRRGPAALV
ncbi:hypothetical protein K438DRAFT_1765197 [Mycena galopus ATCC 62051]|nr:hypothetical protein K438DRAFT_1765197 [Mycena galopus ATCC 62051]